jgi:hypothetical protein
VFDALARARQRRRARSLILAFEIRGGRVREIRIVVHVKNPDLG